MKACKNDPKKEQNRFKNDKNENKTCTVVPPHRCQYGRTVAPKHRNAPNPFPPSHPPVLSRSPVLLF